MTEERHSVLQKTFNFFVSIPVFVVVGVVASILAVHQFYRSKAMEYVAFTLMFSGIVYAIIFHTGKVVHAVAASPDVAAMVVDDLMPELAYALAAGGFFAVVGIVTVFLREEYDLQDMKPEGEDR